MNNIRQGRCDFADREGRKHSVVWTVGLAPAGPVDRKKLIRKTDICITMIRIDDELCIWFEYGRWNKRPPLWGVARDVYKMVLALYS